MIADFRAVHQQADFAASRQKVLALLQRRPCSVADIAGGLGMRWPDKIDLVQFREGTLTEVREGIRMKTQRHFGDVPMGVSDERCHPSSTRRPLATQLVSLEQRMTPAFLFDLGMASMLLAASTAFSEFGLVFCGVPILLILILSVSLSTPTCRAFPLFLTGSFFFVVIFFIFIVVWLDNPHSYSQLSSDQELMVAYATACLGAAIGIVFRRLTAARR